MRLAPLLAIWCLFQLTAARKNKKNKVRPSEEAADDENCLVTWDGNGVCDQSNKGLTKIPDKVADGVKTLDLSSNEIVKVTSVPEVPSLEKLDFSHNKINDIGYDAFDNLDNLKVLDLSNNKLVKLSDDIFEWNPLELRVINLHNNQLEFIQHFLFYDLDQLIEIDISNNNITFVHPHAFGQLKNIVTLSMSGNQLHTLDPRWFSSFQSDIVSHIALDNNQWSCDCAMSKKIKVLKGIDFVWKEIQTLKCKKGYGVGSIIVSSSEDEMFKTCEKPVITGISTNATIGKGQTLKLNCIIRESAPVASVVWKAPNGDSYNYHNADKYDGIEAHPDGVLIVMKFRQADAGPYTCEASNEQGKVQAQTYISFKDGDHDEDETVNVSTEAPENEKFDVNDASCPSGCLCVSRKTDCANNNLEKIPTDVAGDTIALNLQSNRISTVTKLGALNQMTELRLDENLITTVEEGAFDELTALQTLSLRHNQLRTLPDGLFKKLTHLEKLILDENELSTLSDGLFEGLNKLVWLYVRNNLISDIKDSAFLPLTSLEYMHIEYNHIHSFPVSLVRDMIEDRDTSMMRNESNHGLKRIFVTDNEFYCDCRMEGLYRYMQEKPESVKDLFGDGIKCGFPAEHFGEMLLDLEVEQLVCPEGEVGVTIEKSGGSAMTGLWFGGMILGIVLCVAFIIIMRKRQGKSCWPKRGSTNYASLSGAGDADYASLVAGSNSGGGSEAFV